MSTASHQQWQARPALAAVLRTALLALPLVTSSAAVYGLARALPDGAGRTWWGLTALLVTAVAVATVTERAARRLLPIALLLRLSTIFPDRAPSRFKLARAAAVRSPKEQLLWHGTQARPTSTSELVLDLVAALGTHDRRTRGHSERVRLLTDMLAGELKLDDDDRDRLRWAALLHDVGKMEVSPSILNKPGRLDAQEFARIKLHPEAGAALVAPLLPWLGQWGEGIVDHHEKYDGTGYPAGKSGEEISLAGRLIGLIDAFETMTAARPYKKAMATKAAREELARCAGTHFDPALVRAFLALSLPRVLWALGPLSFLLQLPFLRPVAYAGSRGTAVAPQAASSLAAGAAGAAGAAALATSGVAAPAPAAPLLDRAPVAASQQLAAEPAPPTGAAADEPARPTPAPTPTPVDLPVDPPASGGTAVGAPAPVDPVVAAPVSAAPPAAEPGDEPDEVGSPGTEPGAPAPVDEPTEAPAPAPPDEQPAPESTQQPAPDPTAEPAPVATTPPAPDRGMAPDDAAPPADAEPAPTTTPTAPAPTPDVTSEPEPTATPAPEPSAAPEAPPAAEPEAQPVAAGGDTSQANGALLSGPPRTTSSRQATFELAQHPGTQWECQVLGNGAGQSSTWHPCGGTWTISIVKGGDHVLRVRDAATAEPAGSWTWTVRSSSVTARGAVDPQPLPPAAPPVAAPAPVFDPAPRLHALALALASAAALPVSVLLRRQRGRRAR